jgi:uncharacterized protein YraI
MGVVESGASLETALVAPAPFPMVSGTVNTLLIYGSATDPQARLLTAAALPEGESAFVRLAHGVAGAEAVDVYVADTLIAPSLAFGSSTPYLPLPAGDYTAELFPAGTTEEALLTADLTVEAGTYLTAVALSTPDGLVVAVLPDDVSGISAGDAVFTLVNALEGDSPVALTVGGESVLEVQPGDSSVVTVPATNDSVALGITTDGEASESELALDTIYGGVVYGVVAVQGEEAPEVVLLPPAGLAQGVDSAPGDATVELDVVAAATESAPTEAAPAEVAQATAEPTAMPMTPEAGQPTEAVAPTVPPQPTAIPGLPIARIVLDPGANLQLRQLPDSQALSLGLAPSGSTLTVNGRAGAEILPDGVTPDPDATPFVDPVTQLGPGQDLDRESTWLNVTYATPDGGAITAWINALFVEVRTSAGERQRLADLPLIPANQFGFAQNTAVTPPVASVPVVTATVGRLDEGVNLQIRRTPSDQGESLTLVAQGTAVELIGFNEAVTWAFVRYEAPEGRVTGWANRRYLINFALDGRPVGLDELEARGLLEVVPEDRRGTGGGEPAEAVTPAPATPNATADTYVGRVALNPGSNLQFRRNPSASAESLGLIPANTALVIEGLDASREWARTSYEGQEGWVAADYLTFTFNGAPVMRERVPLFDSPLTLEQLDATATAVGVSTPVPAAPQPTAELREGVITAVTVGMTREPGQNGEGMPVLSQGTPVFFLFTSNDLLHTFIQLEDGTVGWVPSSTVFFAP